MASPTRSSNWYVCVRPLLVVVSLFALIYSGRSTICWRCWTSPPRLTSTCSYPVCFECLIAGSEKDLWCCGGRGSKQLSSVANRYLLAPSNWQARFERVLDVIHSFHSETKLEDKVRHGCLPVWDRSKRKRSRRFAPTWISSACVTTLLTSSKSTGRCVAKRYLVGLSQRRWLMVFQVIVSLQNVGKGGTMR